MVVDRISLNIALKYLRQFSANEGNVIDILFAYKDHVRSVTKTINFPTLEVLETFIATYAPLTAFESIDCKLTNLYELKMFSVVKNETTRNLIYNQEGFFTTKSANINSISVSNLNDSYLVTLNEIKNAFSGIKLDEYILDQAGYIDCGYIQTHAPEAIEELKLLYNKYKQI